MQIQDTSMPPEVGEGWLSYKIPPELLAGIHQMQDLGISQDTAIDVALDRLHARIVFELAPAVPDCIPE